MSNSTIPTSSLAERTLGRTPTSEQAEIFSGFNSRSPFQVRAGAGCGKTTTAVAGLAEARESHGLALAFNKSIATELKERVPSGFDASTLNSAGHRAWMRACPARLDLKPDKLYRILREIEREGGSSTRWIRDNELAPDIVKLVDIARGAGVAPPGPKPPHPELAPWESLPEVAADYDIDLDSSAYAVAGELLTRSIARARTGLIDFNDQLYMSAYYGGRFDVYPLVLVDEAQDLNNVQTVMLSRMIGPGGRLTAIGDPRQAIYAFRGANTNSMDILAERFDLSTRYPLLTTFRCPQAVVREAQRIVPDYRAADSNPEGEVRHLTRWSLRDLTPRSAILCRVNAPLFGLAMQCLRERVPFQMLGADIGAGLLKAFRKGTEPSTPFHDAFTAYKVRVAAAISSQPERAHIHEDRLECVSVLAEDMAPGATVEDFAKVLDSIFRPSHGGIVLSSVHRAKGREWPDVYILDPWRMPSKYAHSPEALQQERNLIYVAVTRAMQRLFYVNKEDLT